MPPAPVVSTGATEILATSPAHPVGAVDVVVTTVSGTDTLPGGFHYYLPGDANGDGDVTVADIFYLINYFFSGGPPPIGIGDANGDGSVTVSDVFYLINYLFSGGSEPV